MDTTITRTVTPRSRRPRSMPRMTTTRRTGITSRRPPARARPSSSPRCSCSSPMVLSWMALWRVGFQHQESREVLLAWIHSGDLKVDWTHPRRHADRRDAGGGQHRVGLRAPLLHRLHGGGPAPAALLRLSVAVHLRDADAGDGRQPGAAVLRLGGRRARELSADRLLVSQAGGERGRHQGLRGQPRRRFRLRARHLRACS